MEKDFRQSGLSARRKERLILPGFAEAPQQFAPLPGPLDQRLIFQAADQDALDCQEEAGRKDQDEERKKRHRTRMPALTMHHSRTPH